MSINYLLIISLSLIFAGLFFLIDYYEYKHPQLHISFIAGISIAYFFLVLLPEISENQPEYPLSLKLFEFLFVVIGFVFIHITEKLILQKVEIKSQKRMRKLIIKEKTLEEVEKNMDHILTREITNEDLDQVALKDLARTITLLNEQEEDFKKEIEQYKNKIQNHINEDLGNLRFFTNFTYHLLVGIIVVGLLTIDIIPGILFFIFAWSRAIITKRSEAHIIFTDLEIYETVALEQNKLRKFLLSFATLIGVMIGLLLELLYFEYTELFYILYSFISGVILYTVVREVIPEKEKGKPLYFLIGFIGYTIIIFIINLFTSLI
jgi:zinc transporter ZupT